MIDTIYVWTRLRKEVVREVSPTHNHHPPPTTEKKKMSSSESLLKLLFTRPDDFRALLQFKIWHAPTRDLTAIHEHPTSGWDRRSMRRCWEFLDMTSRSFAAVIKELDGDLARVVSSFFYIPSVFSLLSQDTPAPRDATHFHLLPTIITNNNR